MATLVSFHAHPDDECITCAGVMRKASDEGHRVVLVVATRGEHGEVEPGFLDDGEQLSSRRVDRDPRNPPAFSGCIAPSSSATSTRA